MWGRSGAGGRAGRGCAALFASAGRGGVDVDPLAPIALARRKDAGTAQ
jgi:hypothetical protein